MRDFSHTVNVLVKAYFSDELKRGECSACAVTNILGTRDWTCLFVTVGGETQIRSGEGEVLGTTWCSWITKKIEELDEVNKDKAYRMHRNANKAIKKSGYTIDELALIEYTFETSSKEGDAMFNGLMNVLDVLADIHGINLEAKEEAKLLFVKS